MAHRRATMQAVGGQLATLAPLRAEAIRSAHCAGLRLIGGLQRNPFPHGGPVHPKSAPSRPACPWHVRGISGARRAE